MDIITITFIGKAKQYVVKNVKTDTLKADAAIVSDLKDIESIYNNGNTNQKAIDNVIKSQPPRATITPIPETTTLPTITPNDSTITPNDSINAPTTSGGYDSSKQSSSITRKKKNKNRSRRSRFSRRLL